MSDSKSIATTCGDVGQLMHPYIDEELGEQERHELELHAANCSDCAALVRSELEFKAQLRAKLAPPSAPSDLRSPSAPQPPQLSDSQAAEDSDISVSELNIESSVRKFPGAQSSVCVLQP